MRKTPNIQERISTIIKEALDRQNSRDKEDGKQLKDRMSATKLSKITGISSDRIDRILSGKFVRPLKRNELNSIIDILAINDGATLRKLNSSLEKTSSSSTLHKLASWNDQPVEIDNIFDLIKKRILSNDYAIIKDDYDIKPFPSTFDYAKRVSIFDLNKNSQYIIPITLFLNFLIGTEDISEAYDQMQSFFIEDLQMQCTLRDRLIHDQLSKNDYSTYMKNAEKSGLIIQDTEPDPSKNFLTNCFFVSVFNNKKAYDDYIFRCEELKLSSLYFAVYADSAKGTIESTCLKYGYCKDILVPLK